ncbi:MAG: DUF4249 family protein [Pelobium sp.]
MKKLNITATIAILMISTFLFNGCEDVIDIDLNQANTNIVIEAEIVNDMNRQRVTISQTKNFNDDNSIVPVTDAQITVTDELGNKFVYNERVPGGYESGFFIGIPGRKYSMEVKSQGKTYTAFSIMPKQVILDSITLTEITLFNKKNKFIQVNYVDPPDRPNFYNYKLSVNNELRNAYYVDEDRFYNGNKVTNTIFSEEPELKTGDIVNLDFQCIDEKTYKYFYAISQIKGNGGPPTAPANPDSNFNNGALGYLSAHTSQKVNATIR